MVMRPDPCREAIVCCPVNADMLTENVVGTNLQVRGAALVLQILGLETNTGKRIKFVPRANYGVTVDDHV